MRIALAMLMFAGCQTEVVPTWEGYEAQLEQRHGQPVDAVIVAWGPPAETIDLAKGSHAYTWKRDMTVRTPDRFSVRDENGAAASGEIYRGVDVGVTCETTLLVNAEGMIYGHSGKGAGCVGFAPASPAVDRPPSGAEPATDAAPTTNSLKRSERPSKSIFRKRAPPEGNR